MSETTKKSERELDLEAQIEILTASCKQRKLHSGRPEEARAAIERMIACQMAYLWATPPEIVKRMTEAKK